MSAAATALYRFHFDREDGDYPPDEAEFWENAAARIFNARLRELVDRAPHREPDAPDLLERRLDALIDERFAYAGWRLVTTAGKVSLRSDVNQPTAWGGRGHRLYVRRLESGDTDRASEPKGGST